MVDRDCSVRGGGVEGAGISAAKIEDLPLRQPDIGGPRCGDQTIAAEVANGL